MKLVMLIAALLLILAGCAQNGGPRPGPSLHNLPPAEPYIEPPAAPRPAAAPLGIGLPAVHRVLPPPKRHCQIKTKTAVNNGVKRTTKYQVCH